MSAHAVAVLAALLVVLAGPTAGGHPFESHTTEPYGLTLAGTVSVHTPPETVTLSGTPVEFDSTSALSGYEPITVTVTAPPGDARVELFDANGERRAAADLSGDTATIPTDALSSGTYYLAVRSEGEIGAVERVIVSRHDVDVAVDEAGEPDKFALYITVLPGGDIPYHDIEVVATDGVHEEITNVTEIRRGLYASTIDRTALPPGDYAVYARLVGRPGPYVGMSETLTVTVEGDGSEQVGQAVTTDVATEAPATPTDGSETTSTRFPETGVVLLLAALVVVGVVRRLRPRR